MNHTKDGSSLADQGNVHRKLAIFLDEFLGAIQWVN